MLLLPAEGPRDEPDRRDQRRHSVETAEAAIPCIRVHWFRSADHDLHAQKPDETAAVIAQAVTDGFFSR
jgi:hypothetical protein